MLLVLIFLRLLSIMPDDWRIVSLNRCRMLSVGMLVLIFVLLLSLMPDDWRIVRLNRVRLLSVGVVSLNILASSEYHA